MLKMSSKEIKDKFLKFFQQNDHLLIDDSSIIPKNDPTLLYINSGMAPIKKYFTGEEIPPKSMLCNIQPCIRTIDIDEVGDRHHLTSFQMLGSWSINQYFKEKAISLAFEFLTKHLEIPIEKIYVTVFAGDDALGLSVDEDSIKYWEKVGVQKDHIVKCPMEDNFWGPTSETGPCGPCTEVFYDTGCGEEYKIGGDFDTKKRYIEIWNAGVFMQFNKNADGSFSKLAFSSVDTGAGLERLSMVMNGYNSVYDTDLLCPIKDHIKKLIDKNLDNFSDRDILILTDHLRTVSLILSEKVVPSNEGRGYIPRKLIRKCMMILFKNKIASFNISDIVKFIIEKYSDIYRHFGENKEYIISTIEKEMGQFEKVLESGMSKLEDIKLKKGCISGQCTFDLVTTYGLPIDIIKEFAKENKIEIDEKSYSDLIKHHKEVSKCLNSELKSDFSKLFEKTKDLPPTDFVGYENFECDSKILDIFDENGKKILILDRSCMYAESGGQVSDTGRIVSDNSFEADVLDVKKSKAGVFLHICNSVKGDPKVGDTVKVSIDIKRRLKLQNNHTSVHLLHAALKKLFGKELHQCGSKVDCEKFRLDFNYEKAISQKEIFEIENVVNEYIRKNVKRCIEIKKLSDAIKDGATALFESKYGENVRVVTFDGISKELCGGTHTSATGNIGLFAILSVENIGKGLKRITAVSGQEAVDFFHANMRYLDELSKFLKVSPENLLKKVQKSFSDKDKKKCEKSQSRRISESDICFLKSKSEPVIGHILIQEKYKNLIDDVINLSDKTKSVLLCVSENGDKSSLTICVGKEYQNKFSADAILKNLIKDLNGKGGGNPRFASGSVPEKKDKIISCFGNSFS